MVYELSRNATSFPDNVRNIEEDEIVCDGKRFPARLMFEDIAPSDGLDFNKKLNLLTGLVEAGIVPSKRAAKKVFRAEHKGGQAVQQFYGSFGFSGDTKCYRSYLPVTLEEVEKEFRNDRRFNGNVPKIAPVMASVSDFYGIKIEDIVRKFSIPKVRALLDSGLSKVEAVITYAVLSQAELDNLLAGSPDKYPYVAKLIEKSLRKSKTSERNMNAARWICGHMTVDEETIKMLAKNAKDVPVEVGDSIDALDTKLGYLTSLSEIDRLERAYKKCHFKFANCTCELKFSESETDRYRAEILKADDPRQVQVGYDTTCCQHLEGVGESAMMHGLLNPKAGFWLLTNKNNGRCLAQAEIWEENENTLVFDNIEFANDADIELYREIIAKWLMECHYDTVKMGAGYNGLAHFSGMRSCGGVKPTITAYEAYVLSYEPGIEIPSVNERTAPHKTEVDEDDLIEISSVRKAQKLLEEGKIDYFDYVYCDSERNALFMKENGVLEEFFRGAVHEETEEMEEEL